MHGQINKSRGWLLAVALLLAPLPSIASGVAEIAGVASVIDGDTVEVHGTRIRLHGIDAPESGQLCRRPTGEAWRCGQQAALALSKRIGRSPIRCQRTDTDRYGRSISVCREGEEDLNAWMVAEGWAVAYRQYSRDYVSAENQAKAASKGIWFGTFDMPWDWRREQQSAQTATAPGRPDCPIKGNINAKGERIYHIPGGRWYDRTRIDETKGERWFCSEQEARAAGWRRSLR